jgi:hypothetical protein
VAVTASASDIAGTALQLLVTNLQSAVNANVTPALLQGLTIQLDQAQQALVLYLMSNAKSRTPLQFGNGPSYLTASGVLAAGTINT